MKNFIMMLCLMFGFVGNANANEYDTILSDIVDILPLMAEKAYCFNSNLRTMSAEDLIIVENNVSKKVAHKIGKYKNTDDEDRFYFLYTNLLFKLSYDMGKAEYTSDCTEFFKKYKK